MATEEYVSWVCVGLGPSALGLAYTLQTAPEWKDQILFLEAGQPVEKRDRDDPIEALDGAGGAGMFSDGKYSWPPAGTRILDLIDESIRGTSYETLKEVMKEFGGKPPTECPSREEFPEGFDWTQKEYPTDYLDLETRIRMIQRMLPSSEIRYQADVRGVRSEGGQYQITYSQEGVSRTLRTTHLILAGGRFMPLQIREWGFQTRFRRMEVGFRVEGPADEPVYEQFKSADPKWISTEGPVQSRTFCWCRRGEVVLTDHHGIRTYSGRSDGPSTDRSNFGFNHRIREEDVLGERTWERLIQIDPFSRPASEMTLETWNRQAGVWGETFYRSQERLQNLFPTMDWEKITLHGPTIEGVGHYPVLDRNLKMPGERIWVLGDAGGVFRGLIPAIWSGMYLGTRMREKKPLTEEVELFA